MSAIRFFAPSLLSGAFLAAASCVGGPFSFADDRCLGSYNQCQNSCTGAGEGPARAACADRCLAQETRCYGTGDDQAGSALAVDAAISAARTKKEKAAAFERWKAEKARDAEEADSDAGETQN